MIRKMLVAAILSSILSGCGVLHLIDAPPKSIQPVLSSLPQPLELASQAHARWLGMRHRHFEQSEDGRVRSDARLRVLDKTRPDGIDDLLSSNNALNEYFTKEEAQKYRSKATRPKFCVALSGGGIRAAGFAIGVLQGLHEIGKLKDVDIISAVSGGAYALTWYSHRRVDGHDDALVLSDSYIRKQINPDLFSPTVTVLGVFTSFLNLLKNGSVFANGIDSSTLSNSYHGMLAGSFGIGVFDRLTSKRLRLAVDSGQIPMPIIGMSAYPLSQPPVENNGEAGIALTRIARSVALHDTYMEATPYRYGIYGFGFHERSPTPLSDDMWSFVKFSGAAYDRPHNPGTVGLLATPLRLGGMLSLAVEKNFPSTESVKEVSQLTTQQFYVSDGGNAENLAAYPLILRQCETILIADSEWDPEWIFEGYRVLQARLEAEHGIKLVVRGIDKQLSRRPHGVEEFVRPDGIPLLKTNNECARRVTDKVPACVARSLVQDPKTNETNIFRGELNLPQLTADEFDTPRKSTIIYLKLGLGKDEPNDTFPDSVRGYFATCMKDVESCYFPQDPTFNQKNPLQSQQYDRPQFQAYKDLARDMARKLRF